MSNRATPRLNRAVVAVAGAALLLAAVIGLAFQTNLASGKVAKEIGATKRTPDPLCPKRCLVAAKVTAFQVKAGGQKGLFKAPADGRIVAWSVDLGNLSSEGLADAHEKFDDKKHNGRSVARLAILKAKKRSRFKLTKQSPYVNLEPNLGRRPIFTLKKPIRVKRGVRIGLTMPTWAPIFTDGLSGSRNQWITSRNPDACGNNKALDAKPHRKVGTTRRYGCRFNGERILYWAYFVPNKKK